MRIKIFKHLKLKIVLGLIGATFMVASYAATTSIACDGAGDGGLQSAINAAAAGDIINIQGTCIGNFTIFNSITLEQDPTVGALPAVLDGGSLGTVISMSGGNVVMSNLTIQHGSSGLALGSAINVNAGSFVLNKSSVINNHSTGGPTIQIVNLASSATITNSTFSGNNAQYGAAISGPNVTMSDCTITNNTDTAHNAICDIQGGSLVHNTIVNNTSANTVNVYPGDTLAGNIIANNNTTVGNITYGDLFTFASPSVTSGGYNIIGKINPVYAPAFITQATDIVGISANLGPLQNNGGPTLTMMPLTSSRAIAAIPIGNNLCPSTAVTDQRGAPVPGIGKKACDIGAYETGAPQLTLIQPSYGILNFGIVHTATNMMVSVVNTGNSTVPTQSLAVRGQNPGRFTLPGTTNISPILTGNSRNYTVTYTPRANTMDNANLRITASGTNTVNVQLTGTGSGFRK